MDGLGLLGAHPVESTALEADGKTSPSLGWAEFLTRETQKVLLHQGEK